MALGPVSAAAPGRAAVRLVRSAYTRDEPAGSVPLRPGQHLAPGYEVPDSSFAAAPTIWRGSTGFSSLVTPSNSAGMTI